MRRVSWYDGLCMPDANRCQSCAMPLDQGWYGTEADGQISKDYCRYCYAKGTFTKPELTLAQALEQSIGHLTRVLRMPEAEAKDLAHATIPKLRRWRKE